MPVAPRGEDIDGLNHTHNALCVQWCERIAWAHSVALGLDLADDRRLDRAMPTGRHEYDYALPAAAEEEVQRQLCLGTSCGPRPCTGNRQNMASPRSLGAAAAGSAGRGDSPSSFGDSGRGSSYIGSWQGSIRSQRRAAGSDASTQMYLRTPTTYSCLAFPSFETASGMPARAGDLAQQSTDRQTKMRGKRLRPDMRDGALKRGLTKSEKPPTRQFCG